MLHAHVTVSLDGFMTGPDVGAELPMGAGGERLHDWIFDPSPADREIIADTLATVGAVVLGRRTFDVGLDRWNDTPYPAPSFVVTHRTRDDLEMTSASFAFVGGLAEAVRRAHEAAGAKHVIIMGADVTRQALAAGLVDELRLQLAPFTLGSGTRLFTGADPHAFECLDAGITPHATHLRYRVVRRASGAGA
ncbi:dihydrofolate reductase [Actinocorallia herbida]|uniref:Dihydrofolate reductase n=1 Tax=Actinocorallia herbida TaxID=58109 RepID=A0A3N1CNW2_9ACTN|nr:dihydrofolate reductase family protein [Actinocorallia herbida]ROO82963.1 dihydrofolate reductase [Actinocorallia herbida]